MQLQRLSFSLLLLLFLVPTATAQIADDDVEIRPFEQLHIESKLLRNTTLVISGTVSNIMTFYIFDSQEFNNWLNLQIYSSLFTNKLNRSFNLEVTLFLSSSETIHFIFHNNHSYPILLSYEIDSLKLSSTNKSDFPYLITFFAIAILSSINYINRRKCRNKLS